MSPAPIRAECLSGLREIRHGFFTRAGGVSEGIYASLNCGLGSRDEPRRVIENRARVARALTAPSDEVLTLHQVHSATALIVDRHLPRAALPRADAVVTRTPGLVIGVLAADCAPVLFADPAAKVIAAAHAGWRGALSGVVEAAVSTMEELGARRADIRASIGPCLDQQDYEVGPEFVEAFLSAAGSNARFFVRSNAGAKSRFDLPGYIEHRLSTAGLGIVERCCPSTYANEALFYSYRRAIHRGESDYGRHISAIVVA
jgi:polyphenol oxidase